MNPQTQSPSIPSAKSPLADEHAERLSALCDGELSPAAARALLDGADGQGLGEADWDTFHLIGDALRMGEPPALSAGFSARFAQALAAEPTVIAPGSASALAALSASGNRTPRRAAWAASIAAGIAAVASVAVVGWSTFGPGAAKSGGELAKGSTAPATLVAAPSPSAGAQSSQGLPQGLALGEQAVMQSPQFSAAPDVPPEYLNAHRQMSSGLRAASFGGR
jgi:sigma-E factor negative regulatory protein RseA